MGADIVGWITCPLQRGLGVQGFFWKMKLVVMKRSIESNFSAATRSQAKVKLFGTNRQWHQLTYQDILRELAGFEEGIPQCASCPISSGHTLGCYKSVTYPVDEHFERLVFDFFVSQLSIKDSICSQIYSDIVSRYPASGTPWHLQRGPAGSGGLARLGKPLERKLGGFFSRDSIDSAQILGSLFISLESPAMAVGYVRFWTQLMEFSRGRGVEQSQTLNEMRNVLLMYVAILPLAVREEAAILVES
ncbi:MAG: hypothetical protein Q8T09_03825 [Candidatus Melainabacteria bacterium]|nr:hypothetical protein [Candidatus Melainabacteria bacterium]